VNIANKGRQRRSEYEKRSSVRGGNKMEGGWGKMRDTGGVREGVEIDRCGRVFEKRSAGFENQTLNGLR